LVYGKNLGETEETIMGNAWNIFGLLFPKLTSVADNKTRMDMRFQYRKAGKGIIEVVGFLDLSGLCRELQAVEWVPIRCFRRDECILVADVIHALIGVN
jgi:hypothetical protein